MLRLIAVRLASAVFPAKDLRRLRDIEQVVVGPDDKLVGISTVSQLVDLVHKGIPQAAK